MDQRLTLRADGWAELSDGSVAVVMKVSTRREGDSVTFTYRPTFTDPALKLEWHKDDLLQIFPPAISLKMAANRWAERPTKELVDRYNAILGPQKAVEADEVPQHPETPDTGIEPAQTHAEAEQPAKRRGRPPKPKPDEGDRDDQAQL